ncbi:MAG: glycine cleavage system protein GcvH [Pirellulaceae bacterium]|nr:glycine cleavage system protein GcvH [Pirellulaceae bacterium]
MTIDPKQLRYASTHEWVSLDSSGIATIGISAFAVEELTDLVFMALPKLGQKLVAQQEFGEVESVKAVSPLYSPVSGEVVEIHSELVSELEILGEDPYEKGWLMKVKLSDPSELDKLMDYSAYQKQCGEAA